MTKFVDTAKLSVMEGGSSAVVCEERTFCFSVAVVAAVVVAVVAAVVVAVVAAVVVAVVVA